MSNYLPEWLDSIGILNNSSIFHNPSRSELVTQALLNKEGELTYDGALVTITGQCTGRSPDDKYIVNNRNRTDLWWGDVNKEISPDSFDQLKNRITAYLSNRYLYVVDCFIVLPVFPCYV